MEFILVQLIVFWRFPDILFLPFFFVEFELICHNYIVGTKRSDTQTIKTSEKEMINNEYF